MKFQIQTQPIEKISADVLVVFSPDRERVVKKFPQIQKDIDWYFESPVHKNETFLFYTNGKILAKQVMIVGVSKTGFSVSEFMESVAKATRRIPENNCSSIAVLVPSFSGYSKKYIAQALTEAISLGAYEFSHHKSKKKENHIGDVTFLVSEKEKHETEEGVEYGKLTSEATILARNLVNEPSSVTTPTYLSQVARDIAASSKKITAKILDTKDMKELGMGGVLGVSKGSDEPPRFIRLLYKGTSKKTIVLVGKGITFDSGGLSLKSGDGMETMKIDMAGAATILGIFSVIERLHPLVSVVGLIAACENMPSGKAIKPGDIVEALNGKTIEVVNTDAEGRIILADALSYAVKYEKPDSIIDLATLTGACMVALGEEVAGLFSSDEGLTKRLLASAKTTGELLWELPLVAEYKELIKGRVGDIKNSAGKKYGGAITAALFLQEFVSENIPWAHIDIAGPVFEEKGKALAPYGGTGYGVRMLCDYLTAE